MTSAVEDDEIDLGELLLTWSAQWLLVLGSTLGGLALAGVYAFLIAPEEYEASAVLRAVPHQFCPAVVAPCSVEIDTALEGAAGAAVLPAAVEALEPELALLADSFYAFDDRPVTSISVSLRMLETVRIDVEGNNATITVEHSDEARAVALANAIAGYMQQHLASDSARVVAEAQAEARRQLSSLSSPAGASGQSEALITIERSAILARLEGITEAQQAPAAAAVLARPAALPADRTAPRTSLIVVLGVIVGLVGGLFAALLRGSLNGTLFTARAIMGAFQQAGLQPKALVRLDRRKPLLSWQEAWLALGSEALAVTVVAAVPDKEFREAVSGLTDASVTGHPAVLDLAGWYSQPTARTPTLHIRPMGIDELTDALPALRQASGAVLVLAPRVEKDLAGLVGVLGAADAAVVVAKAGQITRGDVVRLVLAAQGRVGKIVVVLT